MNNTDPSTPNVSMKWKVFLGRTSAEIIVETCAFVLIAVTSVCGNLLVVASFYRNRALRTCTNYLTLSLSITDILYPLTVLPLTILWLVTIKKYEFAYSVAVCEFQLICLLTFTSVSGYTMALMAFNRYICVCKPDKYKNMFKKKNTLLMTLAVWLGAIIVVVILVKGGFNFAKFSAQTAMCMLSRKTKTTTTKTLGNLNMGVTIATPYVIIAYCYLSILKNIRQHKNRIAQASPNDRVLGYQENKITWTLFVVMIGYLVTWVPMLVVALMSSYNKGLQHNVVIIVPLCMASNSAINPLIYGVMNPALRREYTKILKAPWAGCSMPCID